MYSQNIHQTRLVGVEPWRLLLTLGRRLGKLRGIWSPTHNDQEALKELCLKRWIYKCVIMGCWDLNCAETMSGLYGVQPCTPTQLVHIIPFSLGHYKDSREVIKLLQEGMMAEY